MKKIGELIVAALAPTITNVGADHLAKLLRKISPAETRADVLRSLYFPVDTLLEDLTEETKSKIDDAFVDAIKMAIETVAAEDGIDLTPVKGSQEPPAIGTTDEFPSRSSND